jgi:lipoprotein signal peptidase
VRGGVAFNVADLAIGVGDAMLIGGALWHAVRQRERLRDPI